MFRMLLTLLKLLVDRTFLFAKGNYESLIRALVRAPRESPRKTTLFVSLFCAALVWPASSYLSMFKTDNEVYVAYIGRFASPDFDDLHVVALEHFLSERILDQQFSLKPFRLADSNSELIPPNATEEIYSRLENDPNCLAVFDNTWGTHIQSSASIIRNGTLPVFSMNADRSQVEFGLNALFIGHDDHFVTRALATCEKILPGRSIAYVGERDHGWISKEFRDSRNVLDSPFYSIPDEQFIEVQSSNVYEFEYRDVVKGLEKWLNSATQNNESPLLVLNVHSKWGRALLAWYSRAISRSNIRDTVVALSGEFSVSEHRDSDFIWENGNSALLITTASDAISAPAAQSLATLATRQGSWVLARRNAGMFVERCYYAVELLRHCLRNSTSLEHDYNIYGAAIFEELQFSPTRGLDPPLTNMDSHSPPNPVARLRTQILTNFESIADSELNLGGERIRFDKDLDLLNDVRLDNFGNGGSASYSLQFDEKLNLVPSFSVNARVTSVSNIDLDSNTFEADLIVGISGRKEAWNTINVADGPEILILRNTVRVDEFRKIAFLEDNDKKPELMYKISAVFRARFDATEYPFDTQTLPIDMYLKLPLSMKHRVSVNTTQFRPETTDRDSLLINGWTIEQDSAGVSRTFPASHAQHDVSHQKLSDLVTINLRAKRSRQMALKAILFPLWGIAFCCTCFLWLRDLSLKHVGDASAGFFVGFIAYIIFYINVAPKTSLATWADRFFSVTFFLVIFQLGSILVGNVIYGESRMQRADHVRLTHFSRILVTSIFIYMTTLLLSHIYSTAPT